jgi:hypothetical protein
VDVNCTSLYFHSEYNGTNWDHVSDEDAFPPAPFNHLPDPIYSSGLGKQFSKVSQSAAAMLVGVMRPNPNFRTSSAPIHLMGGVAKKSIDTAPIRKSLVKVFFPSNSSSVYVNIFNICFPSNFLSVYINIFSNPNCRTSSMPMERVGSAGIRGNTSTAVHVHVLVPNRTSGTLIEGIGAAGIWGTHASTLASTISGRLGAAEEGRNTSVCTCAKG